MRRCKEQWCFMGTLPYYAGTLTLPSWRDTRALPQAKLGCSSNGNAMEHAQPLSGSWRFRTVLRQPLLYTFQRPNTFDLLLENAVSAHYLLSLSSIYLEPCSFLSLSAFELDCLEGNRAWGSSRQASVPEDLCILYYVHYYSVSSSLILHLVRIWFTGLWLHPSIERLWKLLIMLVPACYVYPKRQSQILQNLFSEIKILF